MISKNENPNTIKNENINSLKYANDTQKKKKNGNKIGKSKDLGIMRLKKWKKKINLIKIK